MWGSSSDINSYPLGVCRLKLGGKVSGPQVVPGDQFATT